MARAILADGRPIRKSQLRAAKRKHAQLSLGHHTTFGRPKNLNELVYRRLQVKRQRLARGEK